MGCKLFNKFFKKDNFLSFPALNEKMKTLWHIICHINKNSARLWYFYFFCRCENTLTGKVLPPNMLLGIIRMKINRYSRSVPIHPLTSQFIT